MSTSNAGGRPRHRGLRGRVWLAAIMLSWLAACSTSSSAGEPATVRFRTGTIVDVGPLAELNPTRPDRCARPSPQFEQQLGYVVMYRTTVGYRTRVAAQKKGEQAVVGEVVSVDERSCSVVPQRGSPG